MRDQLVAEAVVGDVAGDQHDLGAERPEVVDDAQEAQIRIRWVDAEHRRELLGLGPALDQPLGRGLVPLHGARQQIADQLLVLARPALGPMHHPFGIDQAQLVGAALPITQALDGPALPDV